ncbi:hypothetical protein ElyMa_000387400 [Elysia marginata]|uniref:Uncharacterized protein n=1 Tax=Elysia marginata TaxID=1093978 RepID=A0AAV4FJ81_9GAST|nr:hypothetical protein ElyMa_000387400 [Elysia marginata]
MATAGVKNLTSTEVKVYMYFHLSRGFRPATPFCYRVFSGHHSGMLAQSTNIYVSRICNKCLPSETMSEYSEKKIINWRLRRSGGDEDITRKQKRHHDTIIIFKGLMSSRNMV